MAAPDFNSPEYKAYLQDQIEDGFSGDFDHKYLGWLFKNDHFRTNLTITRDWKVLDVGCRSFGSYKIWKGLGVDGIQGIDVGKKGLEYCEKNKLPCLEVDAHRMTETFEDNTFDLITAFHSFEHMFDLPLVLRNCLQILKPGGALYCSVPIPSINWGRGHWADIPTEVAFEKMVSDVGFEKVTWHRFQNNEIRPQPECLLLAMKPVQ